MTLEEFFLKKKIHIPAFAQAWPEEWKRVSEIFHQTGPKSFDHLMKFRFNEWRLRFPLPRTEEIKPEQTP